MTRSPRRLRLPSITALLAVAACAAAPAHAVAVIDDFAAGFSTASASPGHWQYGWATAPSGAFMLDATTTLYAAGDAVFAWSRAGTAWPTVALNTGAVAVDFGGSDVVHLEPGEGLLHPGQFGEYAVVKLTVASDVDAVLDVRFVGADRVPTTTDAHVLLNGAALYDVAIGAFGQVGHYGVTRAFHAGDVLTFAVGPGGNGFVDDSTGFYATLSAAPVPEPASALLLALGGLAVGGLLQTKRKATEPKGP